jgi:hypothetical protein
VPLQSAREGDFVAAVSEAADVAGAAVDKMGNLFEKSEGGGQNAQSYPKRAALASGSDYFADCGPFNT